MSSVTICSPLLRMTPNNLTKFLCCSFLKEIHLKPDDILKDRLPLVDRNPPRRLTSWRPSPAGKPERSHHTWWSSPPPSGPRTRPRKQLRVKRTVTPFEGNFMLCVDIFFLTVIAQKGSNSKRCYQKSTNIQKTIIYWTFFWIFIYFELLWVN